MEKTKTLCRICKSVTNCAILAQYQSSGEEYDGDIRWWETYQVIQCMGCDDISFRLVSTCTEDIDPRTGDLEESVTLYPERLGGGDPMPGYQDFPPKTERIYLETLKALCLLY